MAGHYFVKQYLVYFCNHNEEERASCFTLIIEPGHEISYYVVCMTSRGSDQPAHMCSLISLC